MQRKVAVGNDTPIPPLSSDFSFRGIRKTVNLDHKKKCGRLHASIRRASRRQSSLIFLASSRVSERDSFNQFAFALPLYHCKSVVLRPLPLLNVGDDGSSAVKRAAMKADKIEHQLGTDHARTDAENTHVIMFNSLVGRIGVVAHSGTDA